MFESTKWILDETISQDKFDQLIICTIKSPLSASGNGSDNKQKEIAIFKRFEFAAKLQRMSVIVKDSTENNFCIYVKGAPETIRELCNPATIPKNFHNILTLYTQV